MSKACTRRTTKIKKDGSDKKRRSKQGPDASFNRGDFKEVGAARILCGRESKDAQIQELGFGDVLCSQEPFLDSSQDLDCNREVRWDYQSPEKVKKLKKCRGQYSSQEVRKILENFSGANAKLEDPLLPSVRLYLPLSNVVPPKHSRLDKKKEKIARKHRQKVQNTDHVQQVIQLLQDQTVKPTADCKKKCKRQSEAPTNHLIEGYDRSHSVSSTVYSPSFVNGDDNCWSDEDLFQDNSFLIEATQNPEKFFIAPQNAAAMPKQCLPEQTHTSKRNKSGPEDYLLSPAGLQADEHKSLLAESFVVPPSCASKQSSIFGAKSSAKVPASFVPSFSSVSLSNAFANSVNKLKNVQISGIYRGSISAKNVIVGPTNGLGHAKSTTDSADGSKPFGTSTSKLDSRNSSGPDNAAANKSNNLNTSKCISGTKFVSQNSQSVIVNALPGAVYKTSFRKFKSFQENSSSAEIRSNCDRSKEKQKSNLNSSFRKTLSFDSSLSPNRKTGLLHMTDDKLSTSGFPKYQGKTESMSAALDFRSESNEATKSRVTCLQLQFEKVPCVHETQEDGFDVSLPDDVFQKLMEVDEILDSQADILGTTATTVLPGLCNNKNSLPDMASGTASEVFRQASGLNGAKLDALVLDMALGAVTVNSSVSCEAKNSMFKDKDNCVSDVLEPVSRQLSMPKFTETLPSPVRSVANLQNRQRGRKNSPAHAYFKKTFTLQRSSPRHLKVDKHRRPSLPSSSTPVKYSKSESCCAKEEDAVAVKDCSASFLDSVFDDSFTNDKALFESQILPFLEKVEAEATLSQRELSSQIKCSSKEIEEKRQAAIQKRSVRLSQTNKASGLK